MWDWIEDVVGDVFPELNGFLGMATGAEPPALAGKGQKKLMLAGGVGAAHPGESFVQVTASQVFLDHFVHNRPEEPLLRQPENARRLSWRSSNEQFVLDCVMGVFHSYTVNAELMTLSKVHDLFGICVGHKEMASSLR